MFIALAIAFVLAAAIEIAGMEKVVVFSAGTDGSDGPTDAAGAIADGATLERNPEARRRCIAAHGTACCICGFSFGAVYGPEAEGYIHVHHIRPLAQVGGE